MLDLYYGEIFKEKNAQVYSNSLYLVFCQEYVDLEIFALQKETFA